MENETKNILKNRGKNIEEAYRLRMIKSVSREMAHFINASVESMDSDFDENVEIDKQYITNMILRIKYDIETLERYL